MSTAGIWSLRDPLSIQPDVKVEVEHNGSTLYLAAFVTPWERDDEFAMERTELMLRSAWLRALEYDDPPQAFTFVCEWLLWQRVPQSQPATRWL